MHRFYLPPEQCQSSNLVLSESDAHHGLHVLRLRPDERVAVLDGEGHEFHCKVGAMDRHGVSLAVLQKNFIPPLPHQLTLVQAIPRGKTMDSIVQKATELGVQRIVPLLSERITVHLDGEDAIHKVGKWQTTAIEAIKQCGSAWLPRVDAPLTPKNFLAHAYPSFTRNSPRQLLKERSFYLSIGLMRCCPRFRRLCRLGRASRRSRPKVLIARPP